VLCGIVAVLQIIVNQQPCVQGVNGSSSKSDSKYCMLCNNCCDNDEVKLGQLGQVRFLRTMAYS